MKRRRDCSSQSRKEVTEVSKSQLEPLDSRLTRATLLSGALGVAVAASPAAHALAAMTGPESTRVTPGGRLRVGIVGSGSGESMNPNAGGGESTVARSKPLFEGLAEFDSRAKVYNVLATEISPNANATVWTIRLRQDVVFHDGSPFTADDVVYSLQYITTPSNKALGASALTFLQPQNVRKLDKYTVQLQLDRPFSLLRTILAQRNIRMFKNGLTDFRNPIGTGPFKFNSFTPGERSLYVRHNEYHENGLPYLAELEILSIDEPAARLAALIAGQVDAISQLDYNFIPVVKKKPNLRVVEGPSGAFSAPIMTVTQAPFKDNRVRQALRLMVDRQQIVRQALGGHGRLGNDLSSWYDPSYASGLPQRQHDPERARALLKAAGRKNLKITLHTADVFPGMLDSSVLIAEQAKQAGVKISLRKWPTDQYWVSAFLKFPFTNTGWAGWPVITQFNLEFVSTAGQNTTDWRRPSWDALVAKALATVNEKRRQALLVDAQEILWNEGGQILWGFLNVVDGVSAKVQGIQPSVIRNLGTYDFSRVWLTG